MFYNIDPKLENLARCERFSLFGLFMTDEEYKFYNIDTCSL